MNTLTISAVREPVVPIAPTAFGSLAWKARKKLPVVAAILLLIVLLVAFSRVFLGVHTPQDVGVSILVALVLVFAMHPLFRDLEKLHTNFGLTPIVAHVDRYISPLQTHGIPERLMELPVLVQANADSFLHLRTRHLMLRMLARDQIHLLGSDCHNLKTRTVNLRQALDLIGKKLGPKAIGQINNRELEILPV